LFDYESFSCVEFVSPIIFGVPEGIFTSSPVGLSMDPSTGVIDIYASVIGDYTVVYTTAGTCPNSSSMTVTIDPLTITGLVTDELFGADGAIDVTATGGAAPYLYDWDTDGIGDYDDFEDLTGLTAGTYTLEVMDTLGCTTTFTFDVILLCNVLSVTVSDFILCETDLLTLDATSMSGAEITWDGGAINGIPFYPAETGTVTYIAASADPDDCRYSVDINVLPAPTVLASAGDGNFCEGETVVLSAGGDADSYSWDPLDLSPPLGVTTYTLTGTYGETGCANTATVDITVHALPTVVAIAEFETICEGSTTTLFGTGATTYTWIPVGLIEDGVSFSPGPIGTYTYKVIGTDEYGCSNTDDIVINVVEGITISYVVTNLMFGADGAIDLIVTGGVPPYQFDWDNDGTDDFDDTEDLTGLTSGGYEVVVKGGCEANKLIFVDSQVGISAETENVLNVYPNPTTDLLTIEQSGNFTYMIMSIEGQKILEGNGVNLETISIDNFAAGAYFLFVITDAGTERIQVVKQ